MQSPAEELKITAIMVLNGMFASGKISVLEANAEAVKVAFQYAKEIQRQSEEIAAADEEAKKAFKDG